jgi:tRNA(fMet)-specific endonuclease VapC
MRFLLDTDMCIYIIKRKPPEVLERFREQSTSDIGVSSITIAEL